MSTSAGVLNTRPGNLEFDEQSGWYYDAEAGFYFDPVSGLWYDPNTELWWNAELGQWVDADDCEEEEVYDVGVDGLLDASVGRPGDVVVPRELGELPPEQSQVLAQFDPLLKKKPKKDVQKQASSPGSAKKTAADMMREKDKIAMEKRSQQALRGRRVSTLGNENFDARVVPEDQTDAKKRSRPPCLSFYEGKCRFGDACYWRHDSEKEVKTYMEVLDCPGKHGVQRVKSFPKRGYQCDVCATEILMYSAVHSCRQCHYDVCSRCATGARSIRLRTDDPGICPEVTEDSADSENG
eukprot:gene409-66_t